jgi:hypothetical protein
MVMMVVFGVFADVFVKSSQAAEDRGRVSMYNDTDVLTFYNDSTIQYSMYHHETPDLPKNLKKAINTSRFLNLTLLCEFSR